MNQFQPVLASAASPHPVPKSRNSLPAWLSMSALMLAAALLFGFYLVTQQAVARAHTHWERAPVERTAVLDSCVSSSLDSSVQDCLRLR